MNIGSLSLKGIIALLLWSPIAGQMLAADVRPPAFAGQFYPAEPGQLKMAIEQFLIGSAEAKGEKPVAILAPHAGYVYSGQIAADAYRQVMGCTYQTIVVIGVNHTTGNFEGISFGDYDAFRTPLGNVPVDSDAIAALLSECKDCSQSRQVHIREHSIEVQIPFIQVLFPKARIIPAVIHPPDFEMCLRFGRALGKVLKHRQALIVISSDLSHYPASNDAAKADRQTLDAIASLDMSRFASLMKKLNAPNLNTRACGEAAIIAGITAAKSLGAKRAYIARYANSGDTPAGDRSRAVGYGAVVLVSDDAHAKIAEQAIPLSGSIPLQAFEKKALLTYAREMILRRFEPQKSQPGTNFSARLSVPQGAFVTLRKKGELRGCIGRMAADTELGITVGQMALQAAFNDPRFSPVELSEIRHLEIEISVLTPMRSVSAATDIVVGRDGVLLSKAGRSAVFLPQVAPENNWNRKEMLDNLCGKAGMPAGCWKQDAQFQVFQAEVFSESKVK